MVARMPPTRSGVATLAIGILALACATPLIKWAPPAPAMTVAAGRVALSAVLLGALGWRGLGAIRQLGAREGGLVVAAGLLLGVHFGLWITSLYLTSAAASVSLVATSPVFAALLGALVGDRVARREWSGIAIAVVGCAIIAGDDWDAGGRALVGDLLALAAAVASAAYLVVGRRLKHAMPLLAYLAVVNAVAGVGLLVAALATGATMLGLPWHSYAAIALAAVVPSLVGHTLLNRAVRTTPTHLVALAILGEPVGASLLTWAVFAEQPPVNAALGGAIVLAGIALGFAGRR
jgi:drug/metabolite transporter (DMT)-like permease